MVDGFVPIQGIQGLLRSEHYTKLLGPVICEYADKGG